MLDTDGVWGKVPNIVTVNYSDGSVDNIEAVPGGFSPLSTPFPFPYVPRFRAMNTRIIRTWDVTSQTSARLWSVEGPSNQDPKGTLEKANGG